MFLLASFAFIGGTVVGGFALYYSTTSRYLADPFIDRLTKKKVSQPPKINKSILSGPQLVQDIFSDTRQQYQQSLSSSHDVTLEQIAEQKHKRNLGIAMVGFVSATAGALVSPVFYLPSIVCTLIASYTYIEDAYRIIVHERRLDYRILWAITILASLAWGFIWAAAFGTVFGLIGTYLVARTENRSQSSIVDLFGGQIRTVWLLIDDKEVEVPIEQVRVGDIVLVHAGQMIPVDGMITTGVASIDQHLLTGEAQPAEKGVGDTVLASTVVLAGQLHIRVEKAGTMTVASQITDILNQTTDFKQTLQSRTDRWLNLMALPMVGLSALALSVTGISGAISVLWYYPGSRMIFFGPVSMLSYVQIAAQRGILVKDGRALEVLNEVDTIVFDKTGTLTLEQPIVSRIICLSEATEMNLLRYAAAAEAKQSHPIAQAILQAAAEHGLALPPLEDAQYKVGYGLKVQIDNRLVSVGSIRFMALEEIDVPQEIRAQQLQSHAQGHSLIFVALDNELAGVIELQPTIRPEASQIIRSLHRYDVEILIISGDNEILTSQLATELGINRYFAEVLPEDKASLVKQWQAEGHKVCFVGDGINDSIALKTADVAVSLRGATTIATDMAQIVFMDGTLRQLPSLFELADEFAANMRLNLVAATLPGVVGIASTLLFGWGITICVLFTQVSTPVNLYNALKPLMDERKKQAQ